MSEQMKQGAASAVPPRLAAAIEAIRAGRMVIMVDDEDRENEGDLVMAAEFMTPEAMNFMVTHGRGLVCLPLTPERVDQLGLSMMTALNTAPRSTAFTVSIEAAEGVTTGISAHDRARTVLAAVAPDAGPSDLVMPGHIFPLRAVPGGVLARDGHTEGSIDLARLAGCAPAAVICEIMSNDGTMARRPELERFGVRHRLPILSIEELTLWVREHGTAEVVMPAAVAAGEETVTAELAEAALPSSYGGDDLVIHAFRDTDGTEHVAVVKGDPSQGVPVVRLHSECVTGDVLGSMRCDCGAQLHAALDRLRSSECGVLIYLRGHEGRGIGLGNKIRAYALQDRGLDTIDANHRLGFATDTRDWSAAASILRDLGVRTLDLLTNNPDKVAALEQRGFTVRSRIGVEIAPNPFNRAYLEAKRLRMGHFLRADSVQPATVK
ncbi:3,4-dihydroxy-2-butanone-4-phosphate synthase [Acetobacter sp. AN02]|uniref:3,4-dihydroxy-2-butanone-4-phosphate synthase n=1 Tax=Acetobacter sp. AN02 TaxID=2894186 RepID=UPI002434562A|nr:3,4-dihydroxy-2-butanone-4-phosphate synthase [Acetobacter sp. AN02]MDG6093678.1 3,4-dihydroxy-2-butanone-4-phosphate synthase [Acetobacter sp. AN02]